MGYLSLASEFPNDNAAISGGAIWICENLTGSATAELPPAPVSEAPAESFAPVTADSFVLYFDDDDHYVDGPVDIEVRGQPLEVAVLSARDAETGTGTDTESAADVEAGADVDAARFSHFESALVAALLDQGATRSAALVPRLLRLEAISVDALSKDVLLTLQSRGYLDDSARYSSKYRELCGAWTAVLRGSSRDFAACGTTTLDRFGADLLAALLAVPATRADELRRGLRKAGIAAFGVLEAA